MEFDFNVNELLPEEISLIRSRDMDRGSQTSNYHNNRRCNNNLMKIIDSMGAASGRAQNLRGAITSALKLKSSDHHLYLLKDSNANNGLGSIVGLVRVGQKRLYLLDCYGQQHECYPLCVLDFYVHEKKQRCGFGKRLFAHMLVAEQVNPHELAIDRPSAKFTNFLKRHYLLDKPIQQVNNFLVFDLFFRDMSAVGVVDGNSRRSAPARRDVSRLMSRHSQRSVTANPLHRLQSHGSASPQGNMETMKSSTTPKESSPVILSPSSLPPIERTENQLDNNSPVTSECPPLGLHSEDQVRNYSRHSVRHSSVSHGSVANKKRTVQFRRTPEIYTLPPSSTPMSEKRQNHVHLSNILQHDPRSEQVFPRVESSTGNLNENYTLDKVIARMNRNKLGTSWNILGVPSNSSFLTNPYGGTRGRGFLR